MRAIVTIDLDEQVLAWAEEQAREHKTTLREAFGHYAETMAGNWRSTKEGKSPITDSIKGVINLPDGFNEREILSEGLQRKFRLK